MYELTISDLRRLARFGNATVKLDRHFDFRIAEIRRDGIYIPTKDAYVNGKRTELKIREPFHKVYRNILTVKQGRKLLAERRKGKLVPTAKFALKLAEEQRSRERKTEQLAKTEKEK